MEPQYTAPGGGWEPDDQPAPDPYGEVWGLDDEVAVEERITNEEAMTIIRARARSNVQGWLRMGMGLPPPPGSPHH
eukprot:8090017-Pyramimonas_sp.AAC.1